MIGQGWEWSRGSRFEAGGGRERGGEMHTRKGDSAGDFAGGSDGSVVVWHRGICQLFLGE